MADSAGISITAFDRLLERNRELESACAKMRHELSKLRFEKWERMMREGVGDNADEQSIRAVERELLPRFKTVDEALVTDAGKGWVSPEQIEALAKEFDNTATHDFDQATRMCFNNAARRVRALIGK